MTAKTNHREIFISIIITITTTVIILKFSKSPFIFIGIMWFIMVLYISHKTKKNLIKFVGINLGAVILALTVFETYLWFRNGEIFITEQMSLVNYRDDDYLGFVPIKGIKIKESKYYKNKLVFESEYSIDNHGLRVSPTSDKPHRNGSILFFGCSFTYGMGVNDNETMPYQVGIKTHGNYEIYNFGLKGYGPHQMLSALEHGYVKNIVNSTGQKYAIYQAIPDHINRGTGLRYSDYHGPRYILDKNNKVKFAGNFDDENILPKTIIKYLNKSLIYRDIIGNRRFFHRERDLDLYVGIVSSAKNAFQNLYPGGKFHVIFWDNRFRKDEKPDKILETMNVLKYLENNGIEVHRVSNILPDYQNDPLNYDISPYDTHPNALAHKKIAEYIVHNILKE